MGTPGKRIDPATRQRIVRELTRDKLSVRNVAARNDVSTRTVQRLAKLAGASPEDDGTDTPGAPDESDDDYGGPLVNKNPE